MDDDGRKGVREGPALSPKGITDGKGSRGTEPLVTVEHAHTVSVLERGNPVQLFFFAYPWITFSDITKLIITHIQTLRDLLSLVPNPQPEHRHL